MSRQSSPRANKSSEPDVVKLFKSRAKTSAVNLLKTCLKERSSLSEIEQDEVIATLSNALEIDATADSEEHESENENTTDVVNSYLKTSENSSTSGDNKKKRALSVDEHNDLCEVCETGGDLLCCDTCSLVFHLKCIRPKMNAVPKGRWSCARCIVDELADGDIDQAKKAIRVMNRLGCGGKESESRASRINKELEDIIVAQSGRKFAVRQTEDTQNIELGRFATIKEAFSFINDLTKPKRVSVKPTPPAAAKTRSHKKKVPSHSDESSNGEEDSDAGSDDDDDDELWCTHCLDDDSIILCAFCGCKKCFGKFDSDLLILCDHCDQEIHTYCFEPPLSEVPAEDPWYCCEACSVQARDLAELDAEAANRERDAADGNSSDGSVVETSVNPRSRLSNHDANTNGGGSPRWMASMHPLINPGLDNNSTHYRRDSIGSMASFNSQSSPHVSSAANSITASGAAGAPGAPPVHRGRGRPPNAHKRSLSNLSATSTSLEDTTGTGASSAATPGTAEAQTMGGFGSPAPELQRSATNASIASAASNAHKAAGVDNVLTIVNKASRRVFTAAETDMLEQVRNWAPLSDLERVYQALLRQKVSLLERIRAIDPNIYLDANDNLFTLQVPLNGSGMMPSIPLGANMPVNGTAAPYANQPVASVMSGSYLNNPPVVSQYPMGVSSGTLAPVYSMPSTGSSSVDYSMMNNAALSQGMVASMPNGTMSSVGMTSTAMLSGYSYPLPYGYVTSNAMPTDLNGRPFDVPVAKPKRKHSKKIPGAPMEGGIDYTTAVSEGLPVYGTIGSGTGVMGSTSAGQYSSYPGSMYMMSSSVPVSTSTSNGMVMSSGGATEESASAVASTIMYNHISSTNISYDSSAMTVPVPIANLEAQ